MSSWIMQSYQLDCHLAKGDSIPQPDLSTDEVNWMIPEVEVICRGMVRGHIEAESMREYTISCTERECHVTCSRDPPRESVSLNGC